MKIHSDKDKELERILKALANRRRLLILRFLKTGRESPVGDIANHINLSFKATSKHLSVLLAARLVDRDQTGTKMFYRIADNIAKLSQQILSLI
ncbi:MAG: metalloregulator ArsR/SmtB family transcription factor [bacterium]|nr:metalloregulator ArsR/SmtB family transcription factor [bacterium]